MPIFFFDIHDGPTSLVDEFGVELADAWEARDQAVALLPDIARDELPDGDSRDFSATVRDACGNILYRATLSFRGGWTTRPDRGED